MHKKKNDFNDLPSSRSVSATIHESTTTHFFADNKYSHGFIILRLNHWCHMDYFNNVLATFLGLENVSWVAVYAGSETMWNDVKLSNEWQNFHFWVNYPFHTGVSVDNTMVMLLYMLDVVLNWYHIHLPGDGWYLFTYFLSYLHTYTQYILMYLFSHCWSNSVFWSKHTHKKAHALYILGLAEEC